MARGDLRNSNTLTENWGEIAPPSLAAREKTTLEGSIGHEKTPLGDQPILDGQVEVGRDVEQGWEGHQTTLTTPLNPLETPPKTPVTTGPLKQPSILDYLHRGPELETCNPRLQAGASPPTCTDSECGITFVVTPPPQQDNANEYKEPTSTLRMNYAAKISPLEDKNQYNPELSSTTPAPSTELETKLEVQPDFLTTENWEFRRGGYCKTHQVQYILSFFSNLHIYRLTEL